MVKWILVVVIFSGGEIINGGVGQGNTKAECEAAVAHNKVLAKENRQAIWQTCIAVPVQADPKPEQPKIRGSNS